MPTSKFGIDWWYAAASQNPDPIAFVGLDDRFVWCNTAWCKLLGYSVEEICRLRWQDVTNLPDVGADEASVLDIKEHDVTEYYLEKQYVRKTGGEKIDIALYVHRHPEYGDQQGYVVFARSLSSVDGVNALRKEFIEWQTAVLALKSAVSKYDKETTEMGDIKERLIRNEAILHTMLNNSGSKNSVSIGGDMVGRDKSNVPTHAILFLIGAIVIITAIIFVGRLTINSGSDGSSMTIGTPDTTSNDSE